MTTAQQSPITTKYAALRYGSTVDNSRYVMRDETIIGAVTRDFGGWAAWTVDSLLDMRTPLARELPNMAAAVRRVLEV
jgi:hypothetical protein